MPLDFTLQELKPLFSNTVLVKNEGEIRLYVTDPADTNLLAERLEKLGYSPEVIPYRNTAGNVADPIINNAGYISAAAEEAIPESDLVSGMSVRLKGEQAVKLLEGARSSFSAVIDNTNNDISEKMPGLTAAKALAKAAYFRQSGRDNPNSIIFP